MRKTTTSMHNIRQMCDNLNLKHETVLHKSKMLLSVYRDIVWISTRKADTLYEESSESYGCELSTALTYLSDFAPDEDRKAFESRVSGLFETKWMIGLIDAAMERVKAYHTGGKLYFEILSKCYLAEQFPSESEMLNLLNIERSVFYERKKEAVSLFGIAMWGFAIPELRGIFQDDNTDMPVFFLRRPTESRLNPD